MSTTTVDTVLTATDLVVFQDDQLWMSGHVSGCYTVGDIVT